MDESHGSNSENVIIDPIVCLRRFDRIAVCDRRTDSQAVRQTDAKLKICCADAL